MGKLKTKKPWPTQKAMQQIYQEGLWGSNNSKFYSGEGSHDLEIVGSYLTAVKQFLSSHNNELEICDLGCGDFNIGSQLLDHTSKYIAADIVPELISFNQQKFNNEKLSFIHLDLAKDDIPNADCVIIRQVLQHISNKEIAALLTKLRQYRFIVLTEHLPNSNFIPNADIISGQGIRLKKGSGVDLTAAPFDLKFKAKRVLDCFELKGNKGKIQTLLFEL